MIQEVIEAHIRERILDQRPSIFIAAMTLAALPASAHAQTSTAASSGATTPGQPAQSNQIDEIVVTAQRRSENVQQVPIAVTALTGAQLGMLGVSSTSELNVASPSVTFTQGNGNASVTIRGIGGTGSGADELANGIYLDGVYLPSPAGTVFRLADVERIEILKGPQGTLFGRNASGGAIQIITHNPDEVTRAAGSLSYGNYHTYEAIGYLSGKIADNLYASVTGDYLKQPKGWGRNIFSGRAAYTGQVDAVRAKIRWTPDDRTEIIAAAFHDYTRTASAQGYGIVQGQVNLAGSPFPGFYNENTDIDSFNLAKDDNQSLTISHNFGAFRLVNIASHDEVHLHSTQDTDVSQLPLLNNRFVDSPNKTYTEELQIQGSVSSPVKWVLGAFYYHNNFGVDPLLVGPTANPRKIVVFDLTKSYAGFGQVTVPIAQVNHVTVGLRYTVDDRQQTGSIGGVTFNPLNVTNKKLTYRFAVDRQITQTVLGYASYSRGFKSGLFNLTAPSAPAVNPQSVDTYEVGIKTDLFDRHLRFNAAAFLNNFKNIQVRTLQNNLYVFLNAAAAQIKGAEFDVTAKPVDHLTLQGGLTYLHGRYTDFKSAPFFTLKPTGGAIQSPPIDATGFETLDTPPVVYTVSATYEIPTSSGDFALSATYAHNSGFYWDPANQTKQPAYGLLNSQLGWTAPRGGLYAKLWVNNLTDKHYYTTVALSQVGTLYQPAAPRTYGVTVGFKLN